MFLSIATTHRPATDLGYLLMKHPARVHETEFSFGRATSFFPQAGEERCEAALVLDVDPVALVRGRGESPVEGYVNDRPYAASSFLSVAINRVFRTAMTGTSRDRQALADAAIPLEIEVVPLPAREGPDLVRRLFEPLGWQVSCRSVDDATGEAPYVALRLEGRQRLADALGHLYVLIPVLDEAKHYWVGEDEITKLLEKGGAWLAAHPERELVTRRYLKGRRDLTRSALARLAPEEEAEAEAGPAARPSVEDALEASMRLHDLRLETVTGVLAASGARVVADLGCGEGRLLERLVRDRRFVRLIGLDASVRSLERAARRLRLGQPEGPQADRVSLLHGALTLRDRRWQEAEAVALVEVIEHLDPERLPTLAEVVFGTTRAKTVVVTTPNAEHNVLFTALACGSLRHPDHRFEWTRAEMRSWAAGIEERWGWKAAHSGIGPEQPVHGAPSQMMVFTR
ncbi:3' terminal RNA ribose 2'-O-methyltransferase Hen1 [Geminicoccaceae bacterium 1502E]|nr:3' terminal RNA ribose 2'-O-methyltransferase Hen1 [Geminicoccaceae bacterium 1502E]